MRRFWAFLAGVGCAAAGPIGWVILALTGWRAAEEHHQHHQPHRVKAAQRRQQHQRERIIRQRQTKERMLARAARNARP